MRDTTPFFIVSSGRSGTQMFEKLLSGVKGVEMHHEYMCTHIQPVAAKYSMGLIDRDEVRRTVESLHGAAVHYTRARLWGDSSNKLSWIIPVLEEVFEGRARFIHLARNGRKVVSSFYNKLGDEIYDDESVEALYRHIDDPETHPAPPPEKKYWWNLPVNDPEADRDFRGFDQFRRICGHWAEVNRVIERDLEGVEEGRKHFVRLEDLTTDPDVLRRTLEFIGVDFDPSLFDTLRRPHNVNRPVNFFLTPEQEAQFLEIAGPVMEALGYDKTEEYEVIY